MKYVPRIFRRTLASTKNIYMEGVSTVLFFQLRASVHFIAL